MILLLFCANNCPVCAVNNLSLRPLRGHFVEELQAFGQRLRCRVSGKEAGLRLALWREVGPAVQHVTNKDSVDLASVKLIPWGVILLYIAI